MGDLFSGSSKTTSSSTTDTGPSKFQLPYLQTAFDQARANLNTSSATPFYQGDLYAGMSDSAKSDLAAMKSYATGTGLGTASKLSDIGSNLSGYATKAGSAIDDYLKLANGDATADNIKAAGSYADNPYLSDQIDAANRDVGRMLNEQTLPGIDRAASATGNINSSRAGVAQGVAMRGAADRMADTSATMRGQAYDRGLTLASADRGQRLDALGSAIGSYANLGNMGISALNGGAQAGYGAYGVLNDANSQEQADRQGQADADFKSWTGNDTRTADLLQRYMSIIGGNQWGSYGTQDGTSTQKSTPSLLNSILGAASTAAAFIP